VRPAQWVAETPEEVAGVVRNMHVILITSFLSVSGYIDIKGVIYDLKRISFMKGGRKLFNPKQHIQNIY
jgi:hypothetical protein